MWLDRFGRWAAVVYAAISVTIVATFAVISLVLNQHPTTRSVGNIISAAIGIVGGGVVIVGIGLVNRRRAKLIAQRRGHRVTASVRVEQHAFKVLARHSTTPDAPMDDGSFALLVTERDLQLWKHAESTLTALVIPRDLIEGIEVEPRVSWSGFGLLDLAITGEEHPVALQVLGLGTYWPPTEAAVARVAAEILPAPQPGRLWISDSAVPPVRVQQPGQAEAEAGHAGP